MTAILWIVIILIPYLAERSTFGENGGVFQDDIVPTKENQLITLSTCTDNPDERFLVVGVKVNEE